MNRTRTLLRMTPGRALALVIIAIIATSIAMVALRIGIYPFGTSAPDDASSCLLSGALPANPPKIDQNTRATAVRTWLPLGLICSVDAPGDGRGPQVSVHQSWPATITALITTIVATAAFLWLMSTVIRRFLIEKREAASFTGTSGRTP